MAKHFQFRIGATVLLLLYYMQVMQVNFQFQKSRNKSGQNEFQSLKISSENSSLEKV